MLPNNKLFVIWTLDGIGLCSDVIRWCIFPLLRDWEKILFDRYGINWRDDLGECVFISYREDDIIELLRWIKSVNIEIPLRSLKNFMNLCCCDGVLDVLKWIIKEYDIDLHSVKKSLFTSCCYGNCLTIAMWLYEECNGEINVSEIIEDIRHDDYTQNIIDGISNESCQILDKWDVYFRSH